MTPKKKTRAAEPTTIKQSKARDRAVTIIMAQRGDNSSSSISFNKVANILGGGLAAANEEIRGCEYPHQLFSKGNIALIIKEINNRGQVFAVGLSKDGINNDLTQDPTEETRVEWLPRSCNPTEGVVTFTDEDEEYFVLDEHKREIEILRTNGAVAAHDKLDAIRQATIPSAPHVAELASGTDEPALSDG